MKCVICKHGETGRGKGTVTLERGRTVIVVRKVPADVCRNCGEQYFDEQITARLIKLAEEAAKAGIHVDVRDYIAA